uniref:F-box protein At1g47056-like n=1 Tax=Nicotiana tabacum TaxID=4097 RepID=A0A1S4B5I5_TOBAC|nr:PREDICTED: F-box protein At1g47056-like [Nicotiana tabacum]XP_016484211.1 PREDICTED: F-box protein At1g47056-like [Nicotiana tabacum]XP_016484212.1 PREDICTED: F-box protein At1g47056-like [Nicotiana tabacum]
MGQSASTTTAVQNHIHHSRSKSRSTGVISPMKENEDSEDVIDVFEVGEFDYSSNIPDECVASIFQSLSSGDRKRCSLVCRRWFRIEGQSRHRLSLNAQSDLASVIPSIFSRFDSVTKLALKCDRRSTSIGDDALVLISQGCRNLTRLKLRTCREITDAGIEAFAKNCTGLKKLSCGLCSFGAKGMNAVLDNCSSLEELSVKRLRGITDGAAAEPIGPGIAAASLRVICLKELYNGQCFGPLIIGSKNLRTLKLFRCSGDWDRLLEAIADQVSEVVEVHLERLQVSDIGLAALSKCSNLEILHLVKTPECTNFGLVAVAEHCKLLRKLHIDGWKTNRISDEGLISVAKHCPNLQELVLIGVNPTRASLEKLAANCLNLERLALCGSDTVGDPELSCIAAKCIALRKLCIKSCPVSDQGMEALASGCPNLVKVKVKKCRLVTSEAADRLRTTRGSLAVNLDANEPEIPDASTSDCVANEVGQENRQMASQVGGSANIALSNTGRSNSFKARLGLITGRNLMACTFRRWSSFGGSFSSRNN